MLRDRLRALPDRLPPLLDRQPSAKVKVVMLRAIDEILCKIADAGTAANNEIAGGARDEAGRMD
jgi:hypothetical protein